MVSRFLSRRCPRRGPIGGPSDVPAGVCVIVCGLTWAIPSGLVLNTRMFPEPPTSSSPEGCSYMCAVSRYRSGGHVRCMILRHAPTPASRHQKTGVQRPGPCGRLRVAHSRLQRHGRERAGRPPWEVPRLRGGPSQGTMWKLRHHMCFERIKLDPQFDVECSVCIYVCACPSR